MNICRDGLLQGCQFQVQHVPKPNFAMHCFGFINIIVCYLSIIVRLIPDIVKWAKAVGTASER